MKFYANSFEHRNGIIRIRGKEVRFDVEMINEIHGLPTIFEKEDEFSKFLRDSNYDEVLISCII
ncbi:hypothetical protein Patl1_35829 [Pistacia atlantica]|nr:hypothetical protein Patl1_35829 [Pistacia atlantica]